MKSPTELADRFRAQGLKVTPQRACIFGILHGATSHPTAEAVYDEARRQMPTISLKTVYQTLNDLARMGEIQAIDVGAGPGRFDPNVAPHHHLVCRDCGAVQDVVAELGPVTVPVEHLQGFVVDTADVVFRGRCAGCAAGGGSGGTADGPASASAASRPPSNPDEQGATRG